MLKSKPVIHFLIISILVLGCKCKEEEVPTLFLSQESKDYCLYQPGSWWVYQNEATLEYDTLRIISVKNEIVFSKNTNQNLERFKINTTNKWLFGTKVIELETGARESYLLTKYNGGGFDMFYFDSPNFNQDSVSDTKDASFQTIYDSIVVANRNYFQVKQFNSLRLVDHKSTLIAKNIGIVKLEKPNGEVWNLVDYSITQ